MKLESIALKENEMKLIKSEKKSNLMVEFLSKSIQKEVSLECPVCLEVAQAPIYTCEVGQILDIYIFKKKFKLFFYS